MKQLKKVFAAAAVLLLALQIAAGYLPILYLLFGLFVMLLSAWYRRGNGSA